MVRSSRASLMFAVAAAFLLLAACGDAEPQPFALAITAPAAAHTEVPFPVAVVHGTATGAETLTLKVSAEGETVSFPVRPGTTMAFRTGEEAPEPPVRLEGLEVASPDAKALVEAFGQVLGEAAPEATLRRPVGEDAFVVDLPADREDLWPAVLGVASPPADLRFLVEVLPRERYRPWRDGRTLPRLGSPDAPWPGTAEAFDAFKEAEVRRWREAREAGRPYEPSRPEFLVLPRADADLDGVHDFAVLEWPTEPEHRFAGRILENPATSRDPNTGKPVVLYEVREPYRDAFEAWTSANVGLPMAIVLDWVVRSAPTVNSALRDAVQITLGPGSVPELEAEATALTRTLGGAAGGPTATLVAACTWAPGGDLEVFLPLAERVDTTLVLDVRGAAADETLREERTLRLVPGVEAEPDAAVDARLAEILLGALDADAAAPLLRADRAGAVERLVEIATSGASEARRAAAVQLLGRVDLQSFVASAALADLLGANSEAVAAEAATSLGRVVQYDDAAFDALVVAATSGGDHLRMAARAALTARGEDRRDELVALAASDDPARRVLALDVLTLSSWNADQDLPPAVLDLLVAGLHDPEPRVRRTTLGLLVTQSWTRPDVLEPHLARIAALLADDDLEVRSAAAGCLGRFGNEVLPVVQPYLDADAAGTRAAAVRALMAIDEPSDEMLARIERASRDASLEVRLSAALFLAWKQGDVAAALPVARLGLASDAATERKLALSIVWLGEEEAAEAAPWIEPLLASGEAEEMRVTAAAALRRIGKETPASHAILEAVRADPDHPMHGLVENADREIERER